jgi:hypothetical protein
MLRLTFNSLLTGMLYFSVLLSATNFIAFFKIGGLSYFHIMLFIFSTLTLLFYRRIRLLNLNGLRSYWLYILFSIIPMLVGLFSSKDNVIIVIAYSLLPLFLFVIYSNNVCLKKFQVLLALLGLSVFFVVTLGWLLRVEILPLDFLFMEARADQFELGYWGIRYTAATRNSDYIYPMIGLVISYYFIRQGNKIIINEFLSIIYILTMFASLSRAAILIGFFSMLFYHRRLFIYFFIAVALYISFGLINLFDIYAPIVYSVLDIKLESSGTFSNGERLGIISDALSASIENPFGYGIDNYNSIGYNSIGRISNTAENAYLTILVERGWFAIFFFVSSLFWMYKASLNNRTSFNYVLLPILAFYLLFNYEINGIFLSFILFFAFLDYSLHFNIGSSHGKYQGNNK